MIFMMYIMRCSLTVQFILCDGGLVMKCEAEVVWL